MCVCVCVRVRVCVCVCMCARLETVRVGWDVRAVLSLSRSPFGPKGPLELSSELLIQKAGEGDRHEVNRILRTRRVSPDVSDARGHTALTAATVNPLHFRAVQLLCYLWFI